MSLAESYICAVCTPWTQDLSELTCHADVNLTKNPQDLAKEAANKVNNATPDLSLGNPFDNAAGQVCLPSH